jgi:hypothetical protein
MEQGPIQGRVPSIAPLAGVSSTKPHALDPATLQEEAEKPYTRPATGPPGVNLPDSRGILATSRLRRIPPESMLI